jgi:UDP-N-acetylmuramate dehydrogenase
VIARAARAEIEEALGDRVRFDAPLARFTSLRVGGPADALDTPSSRADLARLLSICARNRLPHLVLGAGFNTLALDAGVEGVVIQLGRLRGLEERQGGMLRAEAGVSHNQLIKLCIRSGFSGLEFGAGIPGTIGGWVAMNAGIPSREVQHVVREIEVMAERPRSAIGAACAALRLPRAARAGARQRDPLGPLRRELLDPRAGEGGGGPPARPARADPAARRPLLRLRLQEPAGRSRRAADREVGPGHRMGGPDLPLHANFITNLVRSPPTCSLMHEARARVPPRPAALVPESR